MDRSEILAKVTIIMKTVFDNNSIEATENTSAMDIEEWDSLHHIELVDAIEKEFAVEFGSKEILSWNNVGDIVTSLSK